jgi:membrane-associated phospholipid phosphatase
MKGMVSRRTLFVLAAWALARPTAAGAEEAGQVFPGPFDRLGRNLFDSFVGPSFAFQLAGLAATGTMTSQEADVRIYRYFHEHPRWGRNLYPMIVAGVVAPFALFGGLHIVGRITDRPETLGAAYAVLQAGALALGHVTVLKLVTGRPAPHDDYIPSLAADDAHLSRTFRPGIYRGGVVSGWPSGHVAVTTAMLTSLAFYYPDNWWLKAVALLGSAGMMLAVTSFEAGSMHWASDAVAGGLMAFPIGMATGRGMRSVVEGRKAGPQTSWFVTPSLRPEVAGALIGRTFSGL